MADYRIQLKDKEGNRQFPVTTTQSIVDSEGRSLEEILANLGDGGGSASGGGALRVWVNGAYGEELTSEQLVENAATCSSLFADERTSLVLVHMTESFKNLLYPTGMMIYPEQGCIITAYAEDVTSVFILDPQGNVALETQ